MGFPHRERQPSCQHGSPTWAWLTVHPSSPPCWVMFFGDPKRNLVAYKERLQGAFIWQGSLTRPSSLKALRSGRAGLVRAGQAWAKGLMRVNDSLGCVGVDGGWFRVKEASLSVPPHKMRLVRQAAEEELTTQRPRGEKWAGEFIYYQGPISARRSGWDGTSEFNSFPAPVEDPAGPAGRDQSY